MLLCKDCEADKNSTVSAFTFDLTSCTYANSYIIDARDVAKITSPKSLRYKPSAAAINPVTDELYILSSINKLLVVADRSGVIKKMYHLYPTLFNQPEGIAFKPDGSMFISNEAGKAPTATILFYQFKASADK